MELIRSELETIKKSVYKILQKEIDDEHAFEYLALYLLYYNENFEKNIFEIASSITNGANDGGIDFVHFDDENSKVIVGQCKFTKNMKPADVITELNKMSNTVLNFKIANTGAYNSKIKTILQNALDRLPEGNEDNVEYCIFTTSSFNEKDLVNKIENEHNNYSLDMVNVYMIDNINEKIKEIVEKINTIPECKIKIDKPKNWLKYETENVKGIMVNLSSSSLISMYNKYKDEGLLDMNIRKYVKNKIVDEGIQKTLDEDRENFWFYNNGLIIACDEFDEDGDTIKIYNFSIVNGGQTTNRIGNYKGKNKEEFYIPCKIISVKKNQSYLFSEIAKATNSQKPIYPRDLKANSPEMKMMQKWLGKEKIYLEIKRGQSKPSSANLRIKNDELGQYLLSFIYQQPGTARSGKKTIFDNSSYYNKLFRQNYEKDTNKKKFIIDMIRLSSDYSIVEEKLKKSSEILPEMKNVLMNAKCVIFALLGITYMLVNDDLSISDIINDTNLLQTNQFTYGSFISNYTEDDYMTRLEDLISLILFNITESYEVASNQGSVTSVSNLFKTDKKYREFIVIRYLQSINSIYNKTRFNYGNVIMKRP